MPDRYADAVRARRVELRALRELLSGGHRAELRSCLALSRLAAAAHAAAALAELRRETAEHATGGDRTVRQRLPALVDAAVAAIAHAVHAGWAAGLHPALRRIATERDLAIEPGFPRLPAPWLPGPPPRLPEPPRPTWSLLAPEGSALWRAALLPVAVLPVLGLPAVTGPAAVPIALGAGVAAVAFAVRRQRIGVERATARRNAEHVISAAAAAVEADLDRRIVEVERSAAAALDAAVLRRRAAVDAELALLAPESGRRE
jgi:hypothetical protein